MRWYLVFLSCHSYSTPNISSPYVLLVFLVVLEYYEGIFFLTKNRVGAVDETFQSRIHMSLCILRLNEEQTYKVWKSQLRRLTDEPKSVIKLDEFEILNYATKLFTTQAGPTGSEPRWNGWQIRNAFRSAIASSEYSTRSVEPARLDVNHFQKVVEASDAF